MRQGLATIGLCSVLAWSACAPRPAAAAGSEDTLVLELGVSHASLRAALTAIGRQVEPPRLSPPTISPVQGQRTGEGAERASGHEPDEEPEHETDDERIEDERAAARSEWTTVPLPDGETLIHVAKRHLGDGRRFVDLLEWNGWSEQDARRLPTGQPIRIKRAELRAPR